MPQGAIGPGTLVASRFRLEDLLEGHSGAWFWRATDLTLVRNVAIHVIEADDPRAAAVLTAARTSATVSDPRFLRVLDALEEGGFVHVVHEWGSGVSLDRMVADDVLDPRRAAWLVREVAEAITVAHRHGVAHGRLLPENVLLTDVGTVKLINFVVGAILHGRPQRPGTAEPPPSEHESDVRNLGALLYAAVTGKWPGFPESWVPDAPLDHGRVCRPRQVRSGVPRQLDVLCDELINPDARTGRARHETAADVVAALNGYLGDTVATTAIPVAGATSFLDLDDLVDPLGHPPDDPAATQAALPRLGDTGDTGDLDGTRGTDELAATRTSDVQPSDVQPSDVHWADAAGTRGAAATSAGRGAGRVTGMGNGAPPAYWGPDRPTDTGSTPAVREGRPGSSWLRLAALVGVLALIGLAVLVGFYLGRSDPDDPPGTADKSPSGQPTVIAVESATDFDPDDPNDDENPDEAPLAVDGDPKTAWTTRTYFDGPKLAPYRSGVGLLLDLGSEQEVRTVQLTLQEGPYDVEVLATPQGTGNPPRSPEGLVDVAALQGASDQVSLGGGETVVTRFIVVWLTALPPTEGGYRGGVAEISVGA